MYTLTNICKHDRLFDVDRFHNLQPCLVRLQPGETIQVDHWLGFVYDRDTWTRIDLPWITGDRGQEQVVADWLPF